MKKLFLGMATILLFIGCDPANGTLGGVEEEKKGETITTDSDGIAWYSFDAKTSEAYYIYIADFISENHLYGETLLTGQFKIKPDGSPDIGFFHSDKITPYDVDWGGYPAIVAEKDEEVFVRIAEANNTVNSTFAVEACQIAPQIISAADVSQQFYTGNFTGTCWLSFEAKGGITYRINTKDPNLFEADKLSKIVYKNFNEKYYSTFVLGRDQTINIKLNFNQSQKTFDYKIITENEMDEFIINGEAKVIVCPKEAGYMWGGYFEVIEGQTYTFKSIDSGYGGPSTNFYSLVYSDDLVTKISPDNQDEFDFTADYTGKVFIKLKMNHVYNITYKTTITTVP